MAPRRSARLNGASPAIETPEELPKPTPRSTKKLQPVTERDEPPVSASNSKQTEDSVPATPVNKIISNSKRPRSQSKSSMKTPNTDGLLKPGLGEMHPSKVQRSTSKQPDSGLVLGFRPIQTDPKAKGSSRAPVASSPSKGRQSNPDKMTPVKSDFKFSSEDSQLSEEARKLMENIRGDAVRIKEQMVVEQDAQKRRDDEAETTLGDRKIAKPRGKAGRFSQAHMAQFKRMDSIAGHPSKFRGRTDREQPEPPKTLKRTISKARLDEQPEKAQPTKIPSTPALAPTTPTNIETKRRKESNQDDVSSRRPLSKDDQCANRGDSKTARPTLESFTTPEKPTIACSTSVKQFPNTTKIPAVTRSPSLKSMHQPRTPQTDFRAKFHNGTANLRNPKSILRRRQPLFSNDPVKIAAGTHLAAPPSDTPNPSLSAFVKKHVDFSASTKLSEEYPQESPGSPLATEGKDSTDVVYPTLPPITPPKFNHEGSFTFNISSPTIRKVSFSEKPTRHLPMGNRSAIPHGIFNKKRLRDDADDQVQKPEKKDEREGEERSTKRVKINPAATPSKIKTPSPVKSRQLPQTTPRRGAAGNSIPRKGGLSMSRLSFLSRPKGRR